jgi:hypothetical protein
MIQSASLRMTSTTCKSIVLLTGVISIINTSNQSITSITHFGTVQYSLVVPIQASTSSLAQKATVRLKNIRNTNPYGNMYTRSVSLTSTNSDIVFPMMAAYNSINLTVDYEYLNGSGKTTSGINNISLLGIQIVRDGTTITGSETLQVLSCTYNASNKNVEIDAILRNTNLNRNDGVFIYFDTIDDNHLVGDITYSGDWSFDITNFVGNWTTGSKNVYLIPYRDEFVITKNTTNRMYDVVNQILTKTITLV